MIDNIERKTRESLIWNTLTPVLYQAIRFCFTIIIARLLNPVDFGIMGIASIVIFYCNSLTHFGFTNALVRYQSISKEHIDSIFLINFALSFLLMSLLLLFSNHISSFFKYDELDNALSVISILLIFTAFYIIPKSLLRRNLSFKIIAKIEFLKGISQSILVLVLSYLGYRYWSLIYGAIVAQAIGAFLYIFKTKWKPGLKFSYKALKELFNFSLWNFINLQHVLLNDSIDKIIIGKYLGIQWLGFYEKAFGFANMPVQSIGIKVGEVMFSNFSRSQEKNSELIWYFKRSLTLLSVICFPIFIGLMIISENFVYVLLGSKWIPMIAPFKILLVAYMIFTLTNIISVLNVSVGNYKRQVSIKFINLAIFTILCIFAAQINVIMVAFAVLIYNSLLFICSYSLSIKTFKIDWFLLFESILPAFLSTAIMFTIVKIAAVKLFTIFNLQNLFFLTLIGIITYIFPIYAINFENTKFLKKLVTEKFRDFNLYFAGKL